MMTKIFMMAVATAISVGVTFTAHAGSATKDTDKTYSGFAQPFDETGKVVRYDRYRHSWDNDNNLMVCASPAVASSGYGARKCMGTDRDGTKRNVWKYVKDSIPGYTPTSLIVGKDYIVVFYKKK